MLELGKARTVDVGTTVLPVLRDGAAAAVAVVGGGN